ncbi:hypothetical protein ABPG75_005801, partial [Micractinium tetrahymenae]
RTGRSGGKTWRVYLLSELSEMLAWLLQNTYIGFGGRIYKQEVGIPMGGNATVFIANYFLFAFELTFVRRLAAAIATHPPGPTQRYTSVEQLTRPAGPVHPGGAALFIARQFQHSARFVDDFWTANNTVFPYLTYTSQMLQGFQGLYPPELSLQLSAAGHAVPYLDLLLTPADNAASCPLTTQLYDKRRRPEFRQVRDSSTLRDKFLVKWSYGTTSWQWRREIEERCGNGKHLL